MEKIKIVVSKKTDAKAVSKCGERNLPIHYHEYEITQYMKSPKNFRIYHAENEHNEMVGYAMCHEDYISSLCVDKEYRKMGIGRALIEECKKFKKKLYLNVHTENIGAVNLYKSAGFEIISTQAGYYRGYYQEYEKQDAYRMKYHKKEDKSCCIL